MFLNIGYCFLFEICIFVFYDLLKVLTSRFIDIDVRLFFFEKTILKRKLSHIIFLLVFLFTTLNSVAQISPEGQVQKKLTGNWNGVRTTLVNNGVNLETVYTGEFVSNLQGGIGKGSEYLDVIDFIIDVDFDDLIHWQGANFHTDILGIHGGNPSDYIGDFQGVSNIAANNSWNIYEIWLQQNLWENKFSILLGMYDLNSEFDVLESAGLFLNSSFGMGAEFAQSGKNGPSTFPSTALAFRFKTQINDHVRFQTAVLDGVPDEKENSRGLNCVINKQDGALLTSEIIFSSKNRTVQHFQNQSRRKRYLRRGLRFNKNRKFLGRSNQPNRGRRKLGHRYKKQTVAPLNTTKQVYSKMAIGGWYYTSDFNYIESGNFLTYQGSWGIYGLWEKGVFTKKEDVRSGLSMFLRLGISDGRTNQVDAYCGSGIVYSGIFTKLYQDQIGLAVAAAHNSDNFKRSILKEETLDGWEVNFELSYRAEINEWCSIQPDVQYIVNPGFNPTLKNAVSFGTRLEICF